MTKILVQCIVPGEVFSLLVADYFMHLDKALHRLLKLFGEWLGYQHLSTHTPRSIICDICCLISEGKKRICFFRDETRLGWDQADGLGMNGTFARLRISRNPND